MDEGTAKLRNKRRSIVRERYAMMIALVLEANVFQNSERAVGHIRLIFGAFTFALVEIVSTLGTDSFAGIAA